MTNTIINEATIPGLEKHAVLFNAFDDLGTGESLVIIDNHDPRSILNQFYDERPAQFTEEYLELGPSEWKVKLTKMKREGCCGSCGL